MCQRMGSPPISTMCLGRTVVSSDNREPRPPARMTTFTRGINETSGAFSRLNWFNRRINFELAAEKIGQPKKSEWTISGKEVKCRASYEKRSFDRNIGWRAGGQRAGFNFPFLFVREQDPGNPPVSSSVDEHQRPPPGLSSAAF